MSAVHQSAGFRVERPGGWDEWKGWIDEWMKKDRQDRIDDFSEKAYKVDLCCPLLLINVSPRCTIDVLTLFLPAVFLPSDL